MHAFMHECMRSATRKTQRSDATRVSAAHARRVRVWLHAKHVTPRSAALTHKTRTHKTHFSLEVHTVESPARCRSSVCVPVLSRLSPRCACSVLGASLCRHLAALCCAVPRSWWLHVRTPLVVPCGTRGVALARFGTFGSSCLLPARVGFGDVVLFSTLGCTRLSRVATKEGEVDEEREGEERGCDSFVPRP